MAALLLRIVFALIVVLALMWVLGRAARRPLARRGGGTVVSVLARQQLTRGSSVAVMKVADRALVLGVTDNQVTLLVETDLAGFVRQATPQQRSPVALGGDPSAPRRARPALPTAARRGGSPALPGTRRNPRQPAGPLAGSVLSPKTWSATLEVLRDRSARKT